MSVVYICDKCGKELKSIKCGNHVLMENENTNISNLTFDFCQECWIAISETLFSYRRAVEIKGNLEDLRSNYPTVT